MRYRVFQTHYFVPLIVAGVLTAGVATAQTEGAASDSATQDDAPISAGPTPTLAPVTESSMEEPSVPKLNPKQAEEKESREVLERVTEAARTTRDPFKRVQIDDPLQDRSELERFAAEKYKLTGIIRGLKRLRAMVVAPNGNTHFVAEGMKMGNRNGVIYRIGTDELTVRETIVNPLGGQEAVDIKLKIGGADQNTTRQLTGGR